LDIAARRSRPRCRPWGYSVAEQSRTNLGGLGRLNALGFGHTLPQAGTR
jgi:hypothetical protein